MNALYGYSLDKETFLGEFESRELARIEGSTFAEDADQDYFYTGVLVKPDIKKVVNIDSEDIIENICEDAFHEWGEETNSWPDFDKKELTALNSLLEETVLSFLKDGFPPSFYGVDDIKEHDLTD